MSISNFGNNNTNGNNNKNVDSLNLPNNQSTYSNLISKTLAQERTYRPELTNNGDYNDDYKKCRDFNHVKTKPNNQSDGHILNGC